MGESFTSQGVSDPGFCPVTSLPGGTGIHVSGVGWIYVSSLLWGPVEWDPRGGCRVPEPLAGLSSAESGRPVALPESRSGSRPPALHPHPRQPLPQNRTSASVVNVLFVWDPSSTLN